MPLEYSVLLDKFKIIFINDFNKGEDFLLVKKRSLKFIKYLVKYLRLKKLCKTEFI